MNYRKIVIVGGGVLGSQIAFQTAYCGFDVTIWLRSESSKTRTQPKLDNLKKIYIDTIKKMAKDKEEWARGISDFDNFNEKNCLKKVDEAYSNIKLETNIETAIKDADLIIESMAENIQEKAKFYQKLSLIVNDQTVIVTNSSTLLPSKLAKYVKNSERFLAMHFANSIWKNNITEIMKHENTTDKYFNDIINFAKEIQMIPLPVNKEKSGYLLNSMLVPFLLSAMDLLANGISDPESIDKAWTLGTGAPKGPFQIIDTVGLVTAKNIVEQYQKVPTIINPLLKKMMLPYNYKKMLEMLNSYIDEGKLGVSSKEGFYKYKD